ncbi:MAG: HlyD family efflux transporter periplasmic adaptor subunit [Saprospiraceae bacterium]
MKDLEPQQYERMYWEDDVPLKDIRTGLLRRFWLSSLVVFVCLMVFITLVKVPDQFEFEFTLRKLQSEEIYRFTHPIYINESYVRTGDSVVVGDKLALISSPEIVGMIQEVTTAKNDSISFELKKRPLYLLERNSFLNRIEQLTLLRNELLNKKKLIADANKSKVELLQLEMENAEKKFHDAEYLFQSKSISAYDLLDLKDKKSIGIDNYYNGKKEIDLSLLKLNTDVENYELQILATQSDLEILKSRFQYDSIEIENKLASSSSRIVHSYGNCLIQKGSIILLSSLDGIVSHLFSGEKQIAEGSILMKISPADQGLYVDVSCKPNYIGRIKTDQKAYLKVHTFPFYEWGVVTAHISAIGSSPDESGNFRIMLNIDKISELSRLLNAGMTGNVVIVLEERSLLSYFFNRTKKVYNSLIGEM